MTEGIRKRDRAKPYEASFLDVASQQKIRRSFSTLAEARRWRADAIRAHSHGERVRAQTDTPTVTEAADDLIEGMQSGRIRARGGGQFRASVVRKYRLTLNHYAIPALGKRRLHEITHPTLIDFAEDLHARDLSPSTIRNALDPVRVIMRRAVARGLLSANPCSALELPSGQAKPRDRVVDPAYAQALIEALPDPRDRALWATALYAGLRSGELRALRWEHLDLAVNRIWVRESLDEKRRATPPKTRAGHRKVPITPRLRHHLARLRTDSATPTTYVFEASDGRAFAPTTIRRRALQAWTAAHLEPVTLHEARHSCISTWIMAGGNLKTVSAMAGHASIAITLDRYGHLLSGAEDEVMDRVAAWIESR